MGRPIGRPNLADLHGEPIQAKDGSWWIMVRPKSSTNLRRWVSMRGWPTIQEAEQYWFEYRDAVAAVDRAGGKIFDAMFHKTDDAKPAVIARNVSSEGVVFHVKHRDERWHVTVSTPDGEWISRLLYRSKEYAVQGRIQSRKSSRNLIGMAWSGWLNKHFAKEVTDGTVKK